MSTFVTGHDLATYRFHNLIFFFLLYHNNQSPQVQEISPINVYTHVFRVPLDVAYVTVPLERPLIRCCL
jgi:hypothetical protein